MNIYKLKYNILASSIFIFCSTLVWAVGGHESGEETGVERGLPSTGFSLNLKPAIEARDAEAKENEPTHGSRKKTGKQEGPSMLASPRVQFEKPEENLSARESYSYPAPLTKRSFLGIPKSSGKTPQLEVPLVVSVGPDLMTPRDVEGTSSAPPVKKLLKNETKNKNYDDGESLLADTLSSLKSNSIDVNTATQNLIECLDLFELAQKEGYPLADVKIGEVHYYLGVNALPQGLNWNRNERDFNTLGKIAPEPSTFQEALRHFRLASRNNHAAGTEWYRTLNFLAGEIWLYNYQNRAAAAPFYQEAARYNIPEAYYALAGFESEGGNKISLLRKAAKGKYIPAMFALQQLLFQGALFPYDAARLKQKVKRLTKDETPLEDGDVAQLTLTEAEYHTGLKHISQQDFQSATESLETASKDGHKKASYSLIKCYQKLSQPEKIILIYKRLADQGDAQAQYVYASAIQNTHPAIAEKYYTESAEGGYLLASFALAEAEYKKQCAKKPEGQYFKSAQEIFYTLTFKIRDQAVEAFMIMSQFYLNLGDDLQLTALNKQASVLQSSTWFGVLGEGSKEKAEDFKSELLKMHEEESDIHKPPACFFKKMKHAIKISDVENASKYFYLYLEALRSFAADAFFNLATLKEIQNHTYAAFRNYLVAGVLGKKEAQHWLGAFYENNNQYEDAALWYEKAGINGIVDAAIRRAFLAQDNNDIEKAKEWYRFVLEKLDSNSTQAMINLGILLHNLNPKEEEELFAKAASLKDTKALSLLGDISINRADIMSQFAEKLKQRGDSSSTMFVEQARALYAQGKIYFNEAQELGRGSAAFKLATLYKKEGKMESAIKMYKRASDLNYPKAQYKIAKYVEALGFVEEARALYIKASASLPSAQRRLGLLLLKTRRTEDRVRGYKYLEKYIKQSDSESPETKESKKRKRAEALFAMGNYEATSSCQYVDLQNGLEHLKEAANLGMQEAYRKLLNYIQMMQAAEIDGKASVYSVELKDKFKPTVLALYKFIIEGASHVSPDTLKAAHLECGTLQCNMGLYEEGFANLEQAEKLGHPEASTLIKEKNAIKRKNEEEEKRKKAEEEKKTQEALQTLIRTPRERPSGEMRDGKLEQNEDS